MKKATKIIALSLVLVTLVALLASCNPSGKYYGATDAVYIEFKGSKANVCIDFPILGEYKFEGASYKIKDGKITFTTKNDKGETVTLLGPVAFEQDGDTIKIADILKLTKKK